LYSKAKPEKVEQDILGYLALLRDQRALDFANEIWSSNEAVPPKQ
jgi:hypothetical protein